MPNRLQKLFYHLSVASPVMITFSIVWVIQNKTWIVPAVFSSFAIILIVLFIRSFGFAKRTLPVIQITVIEINGNDGWLAAYAISYLVPFASIQFPDCIASVAVAVIIVVMIALTFTDYVSPHPVLFCLGYHFYELNVDGAQHNILFVSKTRIRRAKDIKRVQRFFEFLLIHC